MSSSPKISFRKTSSPFYAELKAEVNQLLDGELLRRARRQMFIKFFAYTAAYALLYSGLYTFAISNHVPLLIMNYVLFGLAGILLAFNCAHDCVHNTFSKSRKLNRAVFYTVFNLQGVNATL